MEAAHGTRLLKHCSKMWILIDHQQTVWLQIPNANSWQPAVVISMPGKDTPGYVVSMPGDSIY